MSMNWISKIQEKQDTLYPNCDKKYTMYLYQKGSRYRNPTPLAGPGECGLLLFGITLN